VIPIRDYSGYTGRDTKAKLKRDAERMLEKSLNGYASMECIIAPNGVDDKKFLTNVIFFQRVDSDGDVYKVIGRIGEIERGNYIYFNNEIYLITTKPEDNGTYRKALATLCPTTLPLKENDKDVVVGLDEFGRPIYETVKGEISIIPCVPKLNDASTSIADSNESINLLDNQIRVTIPYRESPSLDNDEKFSMYNETYRIIRVDPSKSINGIGILTITGERIGRGEYQ
jgi:hypothetical protein